MKRALSVYLPMWSIDLVRRRRSRTQPDRAPIMLIESDGHGQRVAHCCEQALQQGVVPQMTLAHARALVPTGTHLAPFTPEDDLAALRSLARWAMRFSPVVSVDPPAGLLLDITGCSHLFGSDRKLIEACSAALKQLGFTSRIAAAPTFGCVWALARFGRKEQSVVPMDRVREALQPLPIAALRIDTNALEALNEVGITRVGEVLTLPRSTLPSRFGSELLLRLDQAMGEAIETIEPIRPSVPVSVERLFDGPATQIEAIEQTSCELLGALCKALEAQESGGRRITLDLARSDLGPIAITITLSRASRDATHLWPLLRPRLERANLGFGVEHIKLTAWPIERLPHEQITRWRDSNSDRNTKQELGKLLDTLTNRLGNERVTQAVFFETHLPERACRRAPATCNVRTDHVDAPHHLPLPLIRPPLLLAHPEPMEALSLTPDGPPKRLRWNGDWGGKWGEGESEITASLGPERIASEWWRTNEPTRDYFAAQDDTGRWLWVYREIETGRWFVHGRWS